MRRLLPRLVAVRDGIPASQVPMLSRCTPRSAGLIRIDESHMCGAKAERGPSVIGVETFRQAGFRSSAVTSDVEPQPMFGVYFTE